MKNIFFLPILFAFPLSGAAQLEQHRWQDRLILLFADAESQDTLEKQLQLLNEDTAGLADRDLLLYTLSAQVAEGPKGESLSPQKINALHARYNPDDKTFLFILIGKDGGVKLRAEQPVARERLYALIDGMPMRRAEMRRRKHQ